MSPTKRILILTDSIAPPAYAPRIVSLCKHLCSQGWECAVFSDCERGNKPFAAECGAWYQTRYYQTGLYRWRYAMDKLFGARERHFRTYIEQTVDVATYDVIFCSTCYYFPLQTAYRLAKKYSKPYVVDVRDIAEQFGDTHFRTQSPLPSQRLNEYLHQWFTTRNIHLRNRVLADAKAVTTISPWHQALLSRWNTRTCLVYNGYDTDDFYPKDVKSDRFIISYTGKIYDLHFRDPRLLFEAMRRLLRDGSIVASEVEILFHIDQASMAPLQALVADYGIQEVCRIEGYIPRTALLPLLHESSILLVLTCQSTPEGAHGIMGTKFYEALGVEKPVLCVRSDEECLAQVINETKAGLAGTNADEVAAFILAKYREWKQKGFTRQTVVQQERFTRAYQSKQLEDLLS